MQPEVKKSRYRAAEHFTPCVTAVDVVAAAATAATASAPISIIDKSVMEAMLGRSPSVGVGLTTGVKTLLMRPHKFFLPCAENNFAVAYWLVFLTYISMYSTGNIAQSYGEAHKQSFYLSKFIGGSVSCVVANILKDSVMMSVLAISRLPVPNASRAIIAFRDSLTIGASFVMAPIIGKWIHKAFPSYLSPKQASDAADLLIPTSLQTLTTVLHLYAIGIKEYPTESTAMIFHRMKANYFQALRVRVVRIGIGFGVAMVVNKRVRDAGLKRFDPVPQ